MDPRPASESAPPARTGRIDARIKQTNDALVVPMFICSAHMRTYPFLWVVLYTVYVCSTDAATLSMPMFCMTITNAACRVQGEENQKKTLQNV